MKFFCKFLLQASLCLFLTLPVVSSEAFWWDKVKAPKYTEEMFDNVAGKGKYVFIEFFTKGCGFCEQFYPEFNKVYDEFTGTNALRDDILIIKIDGEEDSNVAHRYGVGSFPTFILLYPNDYIFP